MAAAEAVSYFECNLCAWGPTRGQVLTKPTKAEILKHLEMDDGICINELEDNPTFYYNEVFLEDLPKDADSDSERQPKPKPKPNALEIGAAIQAAAQTAAQVASQAVMQRAAASRSTAVQEAAHAIMRRALEEPPAPSASSKSEPAPKRQRVCEVVHGLSDDEDEREIAKRITTGTLLAEVEVRCKPWEISNN